uniref:Mlh1_C domain-containing protein n=1 Tax=Steinernema glaseri TaxID=37863 RepID=A0A1I7ZXB0_9BILA
MFNNSLDSTSSRIYAHHLVRTDAGERNLKEFDTSLDSRDLDVSNVSFSQVETEEHEDEEEEEIEATQSFREVNIDSVKELRAEISEICSSLSDTLREMFKQMSIVGAVDETHAMVQYSTSMYMIDVDVIAKEFFYQSVIFSLGNLGSFKLKNEDAEPISIIYLMQLAPEEIRPSEDDSLDAAKYLLSQSEMLWDYFSIDIKSEEDGTIVISSLPSIIGGFLPALEGLPDFLLSLLMRVDWSEEKPCIEGIARCLADFFTSTISIVKRLDEKDEEEEEKGEEDEEMREIPDDDDDESDEPEEDVEQQDRPWKRLICNYLLPACKAKLIPPESFKDEEAGVITRVVDLHDLYKVFERC